MARYIPCQRDQARLLQRDGASFALALVARSPEIHIAHLYLSPGEAVPVHPATVGQLFIVTAGAGWVEDGAGQRRAVAQGEAALWHAGDLHGAGTDEGLSAVIVEASALDTADLQVGPLPAN